MKRSIMAALAAIILLAGSGLAYGLSYVGLYDDPTVTENQHAIGEYFNEVDDPSLPSDLWSALHNRFGGWYILGLTQYYLPALDSFSPEGYAAFPDINLGAFGQFNSLTHGRLAALRTPGVVARDAKPLLFADSGAIMLDSSPILAAPVTDGTGGWGVWGETFGLFGQAGQPRR